MCEEDEKLKLPLVVAGQRRSVNFVTENGLYNILAQSRMEIARSWRRVVHDELINMRKEKGRNIAEQFEEWDHAMDNIYFDEETGQLMQSVTVPGGDVIQISIYIKALSSKRNTSGNFNLFTHLCLFLSLCNLTSIAFCNSSGVILKMDLRNSRQI